MLLYSHEMECNRKHGNVRGTLIFLESERNHLERHWLIHWGGNWWGIQLAALTTGAEDFVLKLTLASKSMHQPKSLYCILVYNII